MNLSITLADGRALAYRCLGDPEGRPLFFFHGTPGSRFVLSEEDLLARLPSLRLILPERPGYGLSDPEPERTLLGWPRDVAELADHLGLATFAVAGVSGGGPHALAVAYRLPDRVEKALIFASPSPADFRGATRGMAWGNRMGLFLGRWAPWLLRRLIRSLAGSFERNFPATLDALIRQMPPPDREALAAEEAREAFARDMREAYRQGSSGHEADAALAMSAGSWPFALSEISVPVHLWHGEEDTLVSRAMAERLAREIPGCEARFVPAAGHLLTDLPSVIEEAGRVLGAG